MGDGRKKSGVEAVAVRGSTFFFGNFGSTPPRSMDPHPAAARPQGCKGTGRYTGGAVATGG